MASLFALVSSGVGPVPLERLEAAAADEDLLVDCLIDEELYWLRRGGVPDPGWDEPYLSSLSDVAREAALDSGLRSLIAKGMVDVDPEEPSSVDVVGVYGMLAEARRTARAVVRAVLNVPGEPTTRYAFHRLSDALVLLEEVSADGFHDFTFLSLDSAAANLSSVFDRRRSAGDESGPHQRVARPADFEPSPSSLTERALHVVSVISTGPEADEGSTDAGLAVYGTADGVWAHWVDPDGDLPHVGARMGSPDLFVLAADAIAGRAPAG